MKRYRAAVAAVAVAVFCSAWVAWAGGVLAAQGAPEARPAASPGSWGSAREVPGSGALNKAGKAEITSVSCATTGNCGAGGYYTSGSGYQQAMVASQAGGTWGTAKEVPGSAALNAGGVAAITTVSCPAAGDCVAGGYYTDSADDQQALVVTESGGTWRTAQEAPGTAALNKGGNATVTSVSCASAGDCTAGGYYATSTSHEYSLIRAFVITETGGTWGSAQEVPGTAALNKGNDAEIKSVSCASAGNCSAGGYYATSEVDGIPVLQAFVITQTHGSWGSAREVPGTAALNSGGYALISSVSCASPGNCGAGGEYTTSEPATQAFVVSEVNGTWQSAAEVKGMASLNAGSLASVAAVSCRSAGDCSAGGFYQNASFTNQAFVVDEAGGTWGTAEEVPGTAALNKGTEGGAGVQSLSCASAGNCSAGGAYSDKSNRFQAFVVSEVNGSWRSATEVPGSGKLNVGGHAQVTSVSCPPGGACSAGGYYGDNAKESTFSQAFVVTQTAGP